MERSSRSVNSTRLGSAGQAIMQRIAKQLLFRLLADRDVGLRSRHARGVARSVANRGPRAIIQRYSPLALRMRCSTRKCGVSPSRCAAIADCTGCRSSG